MMNVLQVHESDVKLIMESLNLNSTYKGASSCRVEEPVRRNEADKDDDPAPPQPPSTGTDVDKSVEVVVATTQGESGSDTVDKGKGKEVVDDLMIDALLDVDKEIAFDDLDEFF